MEVLDFEWRYWPPRASTAFVDTATESEKGAAAPSPIGISDIVSRAVAHLRTGRMVPAAAVAPEALWKHPDAHPVALTLRLLDRYGEEYLEWDPAVLRLTLERDGLAVSKAVWTRILAGRCALISPSPWKQWEVFHWTCLGLAGVSPNFEYLEEPELGHLVTGMETLRIFDHAAVTSEDIDKFVAACFQHLGIPYAPPPLDFAQRELEEPKILCGKCSAVHRDDNDTKCVTCSSTELTRLPYEFAAERDATKQLFETRRSKDLEIALSDLPETGPGTSAHHLLVHWDYAKRVKGQLAAQLHAMRSP